MPWLVMPNTFRSLMTNGSLSPAFNGSAKFGRMSGTLSPGLWFCAPQMMVRSPLPSLTLQTESLSEPGTGSRVRIWATTMPSNAPDIFCTPSTSRPSMVSRSVNSSGDHLKSTYCLSQLRVTFIWKIQKLNLLAQVELKKLLQKFNSLRFVPQNRQQIKYLINIAFGFELFL